MVLLDVLGRRWTLRILWELREGARSFRALRSRCDEVSPTVLNDRLATLREYDFVRLSDEGYVLTEPGEDLGLILLQLDRFSKRWAKRLDAGG